MSYCYDDLNWDIVVSLDVQQLSTAVSVEYIFTNSSEGDHCFYSTLPRFQVVPVNSLNGEKNVWVEIKQQRKGEESGQVLLSKKISVTGIKEQSDCCMPIPWPQSDGSIPPESFLKLRFHWIEQALLQHNSGKASLYEFTLERCLPLSKLFLPFDISTKRYGNSDIIPAYEQVQWDIKFPSGSSFAKNTRFEAFSPKPKHDIIPNFTTLEVGNGPNISFTVHPPVQKPFADIHFKLPVNLSIPIEITSDSILSSALSALKDYTFDVIVAIVDLKGSSVASEQERLNTVPVEYTLKFLQLARENFPHSTYGLFEKDPLGLKMKKTAGDMLILIAPVEKSLNLFKEVIRFTEILSFNDIPFRAGFHIDQATDTGIKISSLNEVGTDFLGPAINWAAKIGDDKSNQGIRITAPVADTLSAYLGSEYNLKPVDPVAKKPDLEIFELSKKSPVDITCGTQQGNFADNLIDRINSINSRVCVGLDPDLSKFPITLLKKYGLENYSETDFDKLPLKNISDCIVDFNKMIIDIVVDHAVAVKPQSAHYERFGYQGIRALYETAKYAKSKNLITILDAKRNDIGSTAEKYALAYLGSSTGKKATAFAFDAITINAYLGSDGVVPFVKTCIENGKGIFILVKTSNPSSGDFQDLLLSGEEPLSHKVAEMVSNYGSHVIGSNGYSSIGAVVGATYPQDITELRKQMTCNFFLMPGYGAQGADLENLKNAFDNKGFGALINSSRAIMYPCPPETKDFSNYIKNSVIKMKDDINRIIKF